MLLKEPSVISNSSILPVILGNVIVLSAVGFWTAKLVSFASSFEPSNLRGLAPARTNPVKLAVPPNVPLSVAPLIVGFVKVLFVSVVVELAVTEISLVRATVPEASGNVIVLSAVGSVTVSTVSLVSSVEPSNERLTPVCKATFL